MTITIETVEAILAEVNRVFFPWTANHAEIAAEFADDPDFVEIATRYPEPPRPHIVLDFNVGYDNHPAIVWESGPYEWVHMFPHGGTDPETGYTIAAANLPDGVHVEPDTHYALGIYPPI